MPVQAGVECMMCKVVIEGLDKFLGDNASEVIYSYCTIIIDVHAMRSSLFPTPTFFLRKWAW